jgi:anti-anti-sigma factor
MTHSLTRSANKLDIEFSGDIDLSTTSLIKAEFDEIVSKDFVTVSLSAKDVSYIDSSGVATLLMIKRRCAQLGCEFLITDISYAGFRVIELAKLDGLLPIKKVMPQEKPENNQEFIFSESIFDVDKTLDSKPQDETFGELDSPDFKPGSFL